MRVVGVPRVRRVESCVCVCGVCGGRCYAGESREALCETACRCAPVWAVATLRLRGGERGATASAGESARVQVVL